MKTFVYSEDLRTVQIKAAQRLQAAEQIFYRGLQETWRADHARNQHLIFVTPDKDYAMKYAKDADHLLAFHADIKRPFDFGFRSLTTSVTFDEVLARVKKGVISNFNSGHVSKDRGLQLVNDLRDLKHSGHKEVWEWYMQVTELVRVLKAAGYDAIKGNEGEHDDVTTFGVFDHNQLKALR